MTAYPSPIPTSRESITRTGTSTCSAASRAESQVPDSSPDRWIDTIAPAPAATACW